MPIENQDFTRLDLRCDCLLAISQEAKDDFLVGGEGRCGYVDDIGEERKVVHYYKLLSTHIHRPIITINHRQPSYSLCFTNNYVAEIELPLIAEWT